METNQLIKRLLDKSGIVAESKVLIPHFNSISLALAVHRLCKDLTVICDMASHWQLRPPYSPSGISVQVADPLAMTPRNNPNFMNAFSHVVIWDIKGEIAGFAVEDCYKFLRPAGQIVGISPWVPNKANDENVDVEILEYEKPLGMFRAKQRELKIVTA